MRRIFKSLILILLIIGLIYLVNKLGMLDFSKLKNKNIDVEAYSNYYYDKLSVEEKKLYLKIDEGLKNNRNKIDIGLVKENNITEKIKNILEIYFFDNPKYYYISNEYVFSITDFKFAKYVTLTLNNNLNNEQIVEQSKEIEKVIDNMISENISDSMTDFEKELALHNALVEHTTYYKYKNISEIPLSKHTVYGALVEKQAVCDGYAKAFKMLLERVGIESIIVNGKLQNESHAWNMVKLDDEYYHVDVTSDKIEDLEKKYVIHKYFNVNDEYIKSTHTINNKLDVPISTDTKYNYYNQKDYYINSNESIKNKLRTIILKQQESDVLEVKVVGEYSDKQVINTLYDLDFNNWKTNKKDNIYYISEQGLYIFIK